LEIDNVTRQKSDAFNWISTQHLNVLLNCDILWQNDVLLQCAFLANLKVKKILNAEINKDEIRRIDYVIKVMYIVASPLYLIFTLGRLSLLFRYASYVRRLEPTATGEKNVYSVCFYATLPLFVY
uniref:Uncharacterized protein n=1 Tax=Glossina austeni TaxID=7395 RepID=A0A1A9UVH4_GLOAU